MQRYVDQLILDIKNAERKELLPVHNEPELTDEEAIQKHFEEVERWLEGEEPAHTFSYYCDLKKEIFPPPDKLTAQQIEQIVSAFNHLLFTWNLGANIIQTVPKDKFYTLLISVLDEKTDIVTDGFLDFEFCNYHPPTCPFGEYCTCKEYERLNDDYEMKGGDEDSLPF